MAPDGPILKTATGFEGIELTPLTSLASRERPPSLLWRSHPMIGRSLIPQMSPAALSDKRVRQEFDVLLALVDPLSDKASRWIVQKTSSLSTSQEAPHAFGRVEPSGRPLPMDYVALQYAAIHVQKRVRQRQMAPASLNGKGGGSAAGAAGGGGRGQQPPMGIPMGGLKGRGAPPPQGAIHRNRAMGGAGGGKGGGSATMTMAQRQAMLQQRAMMATGKGGKGKGGMGGKGGKGRSKGGGAAPPPGVPPGGNLRAGPHAAAGGAGGLAAQRASAARLAAQRKQVALQERMRMLGSELSDRTEVEPAVQRFMAAMHAASVN
eukprot:SAG22_NODE_1920_length_3308_cov_4.464007_2_plen_320_part_00